MVFAQIRFIGHGDSLKTIFLASKDLRHLCDYLRTLCECVEVLTFKTHIKITDMTYCNFFSINHSWMGSLFA